MIEVKAELSASQFPIQIKLRERGFTQKLTLNAAIELKNKLDSAISKYKSFTKQDKDK